MWPNNNVLMELRQEEEVMRWKKVLCVGLAAIVACAGLPQYVAYGQEIVREAGGVASQEEDFLGYVDKDTDTYVVLRLKEEALTSTEVHIPDTIGGKKVTVVGEGEGVFRDCPNLTKVTLPQYLETIGDVAFRGCAWLEEIALPDSLKEIGEGAFAGCTGIQEITVPGKVQKVADSAFSGCTKLKKATLQEGVASIGKFAFDRCESLEGISLPEGLETIEDCAFQECGALKSIELPDSVKTIGGSAFAYGGLEKIDLPQDVGEMEGSPFPYCSYLSEITIRGKGAYCTVEDGVLYNKGMTKLTCCPGKRQGELAIPDSVEGLASDAFYGCGELTKICIPAKLTNLRADPFNGCISVLEYVVDKDNPDYKSKDGCLLNKAGTLISVPNGRERVVVPDEVRTIFFLAVNSPNIKYLEVPKTVEKIEGDYSVFEGLTMIVERGSYAEEYAKEYHVPYKYKGEERPDPEPGKPGSTADEPDRTPGNADKTPDEPDKNPIGPDKPGVNPDGCSHQYQETAFRNATCAVGGYKTSVCKFCGDMKTVNMPALPHEYKPTIMKKASFRKDGIVREVCSICKHEGKKTIIPAVWSVKLSKTQFIWNGQSLKPSVAVTSKDGKSLNAGVDYTLEPSSGKSTVGVHPLKVKFQGAYAGTLQKKFKITPKATSLGKITKKSKSFALTWKKQDKEATGYQIQYSTSKNFTKKATKSVWVKNKKTTKKTIGKLKGNKQYYLRIRTYKKVKVNGSAQNLYSKWSKTVKAKTKK